MEEKASDVEPIAEEEGPPKIAALVEREVKTTEDIKELISLLQILIKEEICSTATCSSIGSIQHFKKDDRLFKQEIFSCEKCNNIRTSKISKAKKIERKNKKILTAKKLLQGWAQIPHMDYHEVPERLAWIKDRCIVGTFSRDLLFQWIQSNRLILGPVNTKGPCSRVFQFMNMFMNIHDSFVNL